MSIHRHAARRDANEPAIRTRFSSLGWHTEQLSGAGMPDLIVFHMGGHARPYPAGTVVSLVDVKMPKGKVTPEQMKKWTELHGKGIPVYVVRTEADVDALVGGTLEPWASDDGASKHNGSPRRKLTLGQATYNPPRSTPVDAAKGTEETFAPCTCTREQECASCSRLFTPPYSSHCGVAGCTGLRLYGPYCSEHRRRGGP